MKGPAFALCAAIAATTPLGCGGSDPVSIFPAHDTPVAADEPRAQVKIKIDLPPEQGCEEAFDLALYADRSVDLIEWDKNSGVCAGRAVTIRYLSKKTSPEAVVSAARAHALTAVALPDK
jgi:hypothetical protein